MRVSTLFKIGKAQAELDFVDVTLHTDTRVFVELIKLAKDLDAATKAGQEMGLTEDEKAFYDALAANESALEAMGDDKLKVITAELIIQVRKSVTIDWTLRESVRAKIKVMVSGEDRARAGGAVVCELGSNEPA